MKPEKVLIELILKDPQWIFASWPELSWDHLDRLRLCLFEQTDISDEGVLVYEMNIPTETMSWHMAVPKVDVTYRVELRGSDEDHAAMCYGKSKDLLVPSLPPLPEDEEQRKLHALSQKAPVSISSTMG